MSAPNDGGPAFPMQDGQAIHAYAAGRVADIPAHETDRRDAEYLKARSQAIGGMSLRDKFAESAMVGELASMQDPTGEACGIALDAPDSTLDRLAAHWYRIADAMLRAREVKS